MENLKLLSKIALSFQNLDNFDKRMNEILADIGNYMDVSRIYIFINESDEIVSNSFEWCDEGIISQKKHLQKVSNQDKPSFDKMLKVDGYICSNDIKDLPQDIIDILAPQQIKSIVAYPLLIKNEMIGFIGFDECRYKREWQAEELEILNAISGLVSNAYQRKFAEEELSVSETNFRNFFETIDDMFIITDLEGYILHGNQSLTDKLGYSLSELIHTDIRKLHPADQRFEIADLIEKLLNSELDVGHLQVESKSGETFLVDSRVWIGTWNGKSCIYTISKDITAEMENLQLLSTIFEKNPLPMAIVNISDDTVRKINPEFIHKTGYTESDIIGKTIEELNMFIDLEEKESIRKKRLDGEGIIAEEVVIRRKDGRTLIGLVSVEEIVSKGKKSLLIVMVDITESVKLRRDLEENYKRLTQIIVATRAGTWELDIQTGAIHCNDYWTELLGYLLTEMEPINMDRWDELTHPEDLGTAYKELNKHISGEAEYYECEMRMKHKDGHWIWVQARGKITEVDVNGNPLKMFGTHSDISCRKHAEQILRESEKRFFLALDKTEAGLWDIDLINNTMFLSSRWKNILGYSDNEIENTRDIWKELIHPDDVEEIKKVGEKFITGQSDAYESISRFKHKDGSWRWILIRGGVLSNKDGIPARLIGTNIDITREHEQALELESFFSVNLDLLCITSLEGEFIKTNKAWEEILGYSSEELKGQNFLGFIHPDDIQMTLKAMKDLSNKKEVTQFINRYRSLDGSYRYIEWRSNLYGNKIYVAARDVTDRKKY